VRTHQLPEVTTLRAELAERLGILGPVPVGLAVEEVAAGRLVYDRALDRQAGASVGL
jgi:ornithine cyclodeaminase/alanine dehydrogenase-like protein (mu-crystallin family)